MKKQPKENVPLYQYLKFFVARDTIFLLQENEESRRMLIFSLSEHVLELVYKKLPSLKEHKVLKWTKYLKRHIQKKICTCII